MIAEAGWTGAELARRVNKAASDAGFPLSLDRRAVSFWLAGRCPRSPLPALIAEALSRGLNRPVALNEIGMGGRVRGLSSLDDQTCTVDSKELGSNQALNLGVTLAELARKGRKHKRSPYPYSLSLITPLPWEKATMELSRYGERITTGSSECASNLALTADWLAVAEQLSWLFTDCDSVFGGGYARVTLADYLASVVAPRLRITNASTLRTRLCSVAAELTYRCGFMCFDDGQHGLAQRYYGTALHLASEAGDPGVYAVTLRALSVQACSLGHYRHARELADAAAFGQKNMKPSLSALLLGQVAVAAAGEGDRTAALTALAAAERDAAQAASRIESDCLAARTAASETPRMGRPIVRGCHLAVVAHQEAEVRRLLGDESGAIKAMRSSLDCCPPAERRFRALSNARLAQLYLACKDLERAAHAWNSFLDEYPLLRSRRATEALRHMHGLLHPYSASETVRKLLIRTIRTADANSRGHLPQPSRRPSRISRSGLNMVIA